MPDDVTIYDGHRLLASPSTTSSDAKLSSPWAPAMPP